MISRLVICSFMLASCAAGAFTFHANTTIQEASVAQSGDAVRKDVETMRRVLDRELSEKYDATVKGREGRNNLALMMTTGNSDAYFAPGAGFIYIGSVNAVLAGNNTNKEAKEAGKESSLWDEVRAEVDGRPSPRRWRDVKFDPKQADEIKEKAIRAMGKYAGNLTGVKDNEMITLILKGGTARRVESSRDPLTGKDKDSDKDKDNDKDANDKDNAHWGDLGSVVYADPSGLFTSYGGGSTVMTLSVERGQCVAFAQGKTDFAAFSAQVKVSQYIGGGHGSNGYSVFTTAR